MTVALFALMAPQPGTGGGGNTPTNPSWIEAKRSRSLAAIAFAESLSSARCSNGSRSWRASAIRASSR